MPPKAQGRQKTRPSPATPSAAAKKKPVAPAESVAADQPKSESGKVITGKNDAGEAVTGQCSACGEDLVKNARFCPSCGEAQGG